MKRILITFALVCSILSVSAIPQQPKTTLWEYKFEYKMNEKKANDLGSQGWELSADGPPPLVGTSLNCCLTRVRGSLRVASTVRKQAGMPALPITLLDFPLLPASPL